MMFANSHVPGLVPCGVETNMDRNAINDAIFKKILQESKHSKQFTDENQSLQYVSRHLI